MKKKSTTKSALAFIKNDVTVYQERSDKAKRESVDLLMKQGITDFDGGVSEINEGARSFLRGCNRIREAGRKFEEAEKMGQFEFRNWETDADSWKIEAIRRKKIKAAQKVYRAMPDRAEAMKDCTAVMQILLELSGDMPRSHRLGNETAHEPINAFNAIISNASTVESWFRKWEPNEVAIETYYAELGAETLHKIKTATQPFAERYELAQRLLKEKGE